MSTSQGLPATLDSVAPRFLARDMEQALAFYSQLGFATTSQDGEFAIVARDGISLHFTVADGHSVCLFGVTNIEALYQQYVPTGAVRSPHVTSQPWGTKGFWLSDPFRNILIFEEDIPAQEEARNQPDD